MRKWLTVWFASRFEGEKGGDSSVDKKTKLRIYFANVLACFVFLVLWEVFSVFYAITIQMVVVSFIWGFMGLGLHILKRKSVIWDYIVTIIYMLIIVTCLAWLFFVANFSLVF